MTIDIHPVIYYRAKSEDWTDAWQQHDWAARNMVKAIKHKPFNGTSRILMKTGSTVTIDTTDNGRKRALGLLSVSIAKKIVSTGYINVLVVPIPSSDHVDAGASFTGGRIANAIQVYNPNLVATPSLYFSEKLPKSSEGGGRDSLLIEAKLRGGDDIPPGSEIVLLDDVFTTGAHMRAVTRYLRKKGHTVKDGFVVARTRWQRPEHMLKAESETFTFS